MQHFPALTFSLIKARYISNYREKEKKERMWSRSFLMLFFLALVAMSTALPEEDSLPTVPAVPMEDGDPKHKHPKDPTHKDKDKHPKEKHHKKHDPKDKHPKEEEPVAAVGADEEATPEPEAEAEATEEKKEAAKKKRAAHSFPVNSTEAKVEDEAQQAACGTCCGVDMSDVAGKLPFINRK